MSTTSTARVYRPTPKNLAHLARVLAKGGLVAAPTETVYGLAADALNAKACRAIFRAKGRPANDPLIVHVGSLAQAGEIAELNEAARKVARVFWPGPLTLVLPKRPGVPAIVTSGLPSVAVRMPAHRLFRELIRRSGRPLAAPSANPFGYVSPTTAAHVRDGLGQRIGYILDGGPAKIGVELRTIKRSHVRSADADHAFLFLKRPAIEGKNIFWLCNEQGGLAQAARRLFDQLRTLDKGGWSQLHVELATGTDALALAINDRLARAAAKSK
ncbi:MAG: Sua5/YciO/YrdC/YwlC family protein [Rariglobus sp.]|nr:Sua5/YciO/YrdC/YwlC family protein [Rariglobus sp.]